MSELFSDLTFGGFLTSTPLVPFDWFLTGTPLVPFDWFFSFVLQVHPLTHVWTINSLTIFVHHHLEISLNGLKGFTFAEYDSINDQ